MMEINMTKFSRNAVSFDPDRYFPRQRLFSLLDHSKQVLLVGVFADSGFGKTSFVYSYIATQKKHAVWYDLSKLDGFGTDFIHDFKLQLFRLGLQVDMYDNYEDLISALYNLSEPLIIVFDDYHLADNNSEIFTFIQRLLSLEIDMVTIILIGKTNPNASFAKLKSRRQYIELDSSDLAFTKDETFAFFNHYHQLDLKSFEIDIIFEKTAGWAAGYQLIHEYLRKVSVSNTKSLGLNFFTDIPDIFEYLSMEVFDAESAVTQSFMLKTSLMSELDPDIIDQYLGIDNSAETINYLIQHHVFMEKNTFSFSQYHRGFRRFLYERYAKSNPDAVREDHLRLSEIYRKNHRYIEAFTHAAARTDYRLASELMSVIANRYNTVQFINIIDGHLEEISPSLLFSDFTFFLTRSIPEKTLIEFIAPLHDAIIQAQRADNIPQLARLQHRLGVIYFHCGEILKSRDLIESSIENAALLQDYPLITCNQQMLADCCFEMRQYDKGIQYARQALFLTEKYSIKPIQMHTLETLTRLNMVLQENQLAESYWTQAMDLVDPNSYPIFWLCVTKSRLLLARNDSESIVWAQKAIDYLSEHCCHYDKAYTYNNMGFIYLSTNQLELARVHLDIAYANTRYCKMQQYYIVENQMNLYRLLGEKEKEAEKRQELVNICNIHGYDWLLPETLTENILDEDENKDCLTIRTLGAFEITTSKGQTIALKRSSSLRLFQFLIINRHRAVNREVIIDAIFPDCKNDHTNHFNVALSVLRKTLEPGITSGKNSRFISRMGDRYQLNMDHLNLDVDGFLRLCTTKNNAMKDINISQLLQGEAIYRGDFMEEYPYDTWLEEDRTSLRTQYIEVLSVLAEYFCQCNEPIKSLAFYEKILVKDSYQEDTYLKYCNALLCIKAISKAKDVAKRMLFHIEEELGIPCKDRLAALFSKHNISNFDI